MEAVSLPKTHSFTMEVEFSCSLAPPSHVIFQTIPTSYSGWFSPLLLYQSPTGLGTILPYFGLTSKHGVALPDRSGPYASLLCQLSLEDPQCPPTPAPPHTTHTIMQSLEGEQLRAG